MHPCRECLYLEAALPAELLDVERRAFDGVVAQLARRLKNANAAREQVLILRLTLAIQEAKVKQMGSRPVDNKRGMQMC